MTTMTTQDERPVQDTQDDVQGYVEPLAIMVISIAIADVAIAVIGSGAGDKLVEPSIWVQQYQGK